jgi:hypothetical protein
MVKSILEKLNVNNLKETDVKYKFDCMFCDDVGRNANIYKRVLNIIAINAKLTKH